VEDLGIVIQIMGSTGGTAIMFILPGMSYLFHFPAQDGDQHGATVDSAIAKNLYVIVRGLIVYVVCLEDYLSLWFRLNVY